MSRILIKGHFIDHGRPDGDSIRFAVDAKQQWRIRLEAIDALETHYQPRGKSLHGRQPAAEGDAAASALQKFLGITDVDTKAPGYIIRNDGTDSKGRVVAFAFAGRTRIGHGSTVEITDDVLKNSANFHMLAHGHSYPCFYSRLEEPIRNLLATTAKEARASGVGVWQSDVTQTGSLYAPLNAACQSIMWPKLFRRIVDFYAYNPLITAATATDLRVFLNSRTYDKLWVLPGMTRSHLAKELDVTDHLVRLNQNPEDLVLYEEPA